MVDMIFYCAVVLAYLFFAIGFVYAIDIDQHPFVKFIFYPAIVFGRLLRITFGFLCLKYIEYKMSSTDIYRQGGSMPEKLDNLFKLALVSFLIYLIVGILIGFGISKFFFTPKCKPIQTKEISNEAS